MLRVGAAPRLVQAAYPLQRRHYGNDWARGKPKVNVTGEHRDSYFRNQNMWRWNDEWWNENESHITVLYRKSVMRHGFAGEQITLPRHQAEDALNSGIAVLPNEKNVEVLHCWNPNTEEYDRPIERTPDLLAQIRRKRQWVDVYWRVHDCYLETYRQAQSYNRRLALPITRDEVSRLLWQQAQVRIDPRWIVWRYTNRPTGIEDLGHTWCWLLLPGGEDIAAPKLVYNNDRVKVRMHIRFSHRAPY
eukprot:Sspe_Gene.86949::Locus_57759_Transcript_1_1_Confidence_1.000_Length_916::g.86949::m.86949